MRSKIAQRIIDETPEEVKIFVKKYGALVVRVHEVLKEKGITQKELAKRMDKTPSEISKWLSGEHNLTLRSIAKLEAELGVDLLYVAGDAFRVQRNVRTATGMQKSVSKAGLTSRYQRQISRKTGKRRMPVSKTTPQRRKS